jgi:hypothetical protein
VLAGVLGKTHRNLAVETETQVSMVSQAGFAGLPSPDAPHRQVDDPAGHHKIRTTVAWQSVVEHSMLQLEREHRTHPVVGRHIPEQSMVVHPMLQLQLEREHCTHPAVGRHILEQGRRNQ